jgi:hypothetical protein
MKCQFYKNSRLVCLLLALCLVFSTALAWGQVDNKGTDFIMAFARNTLGSPNANQVQVHLTGDIATNVTVEHPVNAPTFTTTVAVNPGAVTTVTIPLAASQGWSANSIQNNAVHAFADDEFIAYMINLRPFSSDAALALPVDTMNTEYLVTTYRGSNLVGADRGQFAVVAGFDNTTVTITPSNNIVGHAAGVSFNVLLNRGEGYYAESTTAGAGGDLTGTIVSADRPVGMTNGNHCTNVPSSVTFCDHIFEVAQPVASWGMEALVANLPQRTNGSIYRILASQDNTTVSQDGGAIGVINSGQFIETGQLTGNHRFTADKPIFVTQYMPSDGNTGATDGDPAMGNMIPSEQYLNDYTFSTPGGGQFATHYVTVIAEDTDVAGGTILLDGAPIPAASFSAVPTTTFLAAVVLLAQGTHTTSSNGVHGITVEGFNPADSYIYPGGALFEFINPQGDANPPICDVAIIPGPPPSATMTATDDRPSEDVNNNGVLDPGEDLNNNGQIDEDTGIFFINVLTATNVVVTVPAFIPGDGQVSGITVDLIDTGSNGSATIEATDGAGNACGAEIELLVDQVATCDVDADGDIDRGDVRSILLNRNQPASGPDDPMDADGDGQITVRDAKICISQCTLPRCASPPG